MGGAQAAVDAALWAGHMTLACHAGVKKPPGGGFVAIA